MEGRRGKHTLFRTEKKGADGGVANGGVGQLTCDQEGWREKGCEVDTKVMMQDDSKDVHVLPKNDTTEIDWFT